ncbi:hypothetical protein B7P43_G07071 [Cryptotermes secundus]|uniref:Uncharacterized protein n=1 Tax=Cryptotermes secundus TaxID=105785 RepID=A0A2J7PN39_9NEOP|nr:hypothetical protein B7P43_G07071 [Cryptotermes secundus]
MASAQEKARVVLFSEFKSTVRLQREFHHIYQKAAPDAKRIKAWHNKFLGTGSVLKEYGDRQCVSDEKLESARTAFVRSPRKSIRRVSRELQMPRATVHEVLRKRLCMYAYTLQILQALKPEDKPRRHNFACDMPDRIGRGLNFLANITVMEHVRDSPKVNV